jgi:hypothetical protein
MGSANSWKSNAKSLSTILKKSAASYGHRFGLVIGEDKHKQKPTFFFNPTEMQMTLLKTGKADTAMTAPSAATAVPSADSGEIWHEEGYRKGEGIDTGEADVVKPGDYPSQEGCLTIADMGCLPKDVRIPDDIKKEVERWSRVIVAGGWGGGAMDYPAPRALVLFCEATGDWSQALAQLAEVYRSGGDEAIQNCLNGHTPDLHGTGGETVYRSAGKIATWKAAAATEKGAASIRATYGSRAVCSRMQRWIYAEAGL